jgi:lipopolysaccharide assembly protein A
VSQVIVLLALVFSVVIAIFAVQNTQPVDVRFLGFVAPNVAASVLVLVSAAFGAVAMLLFGIAREVPLRWRHRGVSQQLRQAQARVAELEASQPKLPAAQPATPTVITGADAAPTPTSPRET